MIRWFRCRLIFRLLNLGLIMAEQRTIDEADLDVALHFNYVRALK